MRLSKRLRSVRSPLQPTVISTDSMWQMLESMAETMMNDRMAAFEVRLRSKAEQTEEQLDEARNALLRATEQAKHHADLQVATHIQKRAIEIKGPKGDKGDTVIGPMGLPGKDGKDGVDGKSIIGPIGLSGRDGSPDTPEEVVAKVIAAESKIPVTKIAGLVEELGNIRRTKAVRAGGGDIVEAGTNVTITRTADGKRRISSSGGAGTTLYVETPTGDIDGINTTYTVSATITTVINFSLNGQFIHPADYSFAGTTITFNTALDASLSGLPFTIVFA